MPLNNTNLLLPDKTGSCNRQLVVVGKSEIDVTVDLVADRSKQRCSRFFVRLGCDVVLSPQHFFFIRLVKHNDE